MKVVLLKDVKNMGRAGSVQDVSDGHAMNLLLPRKLAVLATANSMKRAEALSNAEGQKRSLDAKLVTDRLAALAEGHISIIKKANEQGHLYDAVDAKDIAEAAQLPVEAIDLERPIKEVGVHDVPVSHGEAFGTIKVSVEAE